MSHELFLIERKEALDERDATWLASLRDQLIIIENLGLAYQAHSIKADIAAVERGRLINNAPMTSAEFIIWRAWLPTVYSEVVELKDRTHLSNYHFDRIPSPVLKMWDKYKKADLFETFEIWTPEKERQPDPILVGVNGTARHLLARWGESDANLVTFDDIKRELMRRWYKNEDIGGESYGERWSRTERSAESGFAAVFVTLSSMFVTGMITSAFTQSPAVIIPVVILTAISVGIGFFRFIHRRMTNRCLQSSTLMQTIFRHDAQVTSA